MRISGLSRYALSSCTAVAMLAACGGSQPPIGAPGTMPQTSATATHAERRKSWMLPETKDEDLVYVTGGCGGTCILSYPAGKIVGSLNVGSGLNSGVCSDSQGNVYISNNRESRNSEVVEYAHGGTTTKATFELPGVSAAGCSIDSTTGNLAVMFAGSGYGVAIFMAGSQSPLLYPAPVNGFTCAYDPSGNLFFGGLSGQAAALAELPKGSSTFALLTINAKYIWGAGQVQWYGKYLRASLIY